MKNAFAFVLAGALSCGAHAGSISVQVLDKDGKPAADAVVVLLPSGKTGSARPPLPGPVIVTQEKMQFLPAVTVVPTGTRVRFVNNDAWDHHVRGSAAGLAQFSTSGTGFELRLEGKPEGKPARAAEISFDKAGAVLLGCHIHGSMRGHVYVSDSPWALKTGADGVAVLDDVPEGAAQIKVWHADQLIDLAPQPVHVGNAPVKASVKLEVVPRRRRL